MNNSAGLFDSISITCKFSQVVTYGGTIKTKGVAHRFLGHVTHAGRNTLFYCPCRRLINDQEGRLNALSYKLLNRSCQISAECLSLKKWKTMSLML